MANDELDVLGQFLMKHLRDRGISKVEGLLTGHWKAPGLKRLQRDLGALTPEQQDLVRRAVISSLDTALHAFLFAVQEQTDLDGPIAITVRGENVARMSDGLQGELVTEDGWFARFSASGEPPEDE